MRRNRSSSPLSRSDWRPTMGCSCSHGSRRRGAGASDSEAVAIGVERTGRIVTAAALLFAVAIGAFVTSKLVFIKELGVGTALAVLIDASIIRALLVPSSWSYSARWPGGRQDRCAVSMAGSDCERAKSHRGPSPSRA